MIQLLSITLSGFKSFRNETTVHFPKTAGFRLVSGINETNARLGANGAGKSSLFTDAVHWCLYGTSIRGKRTSDLVSWGLKKARIETSWLVDGKLMHVCRMGPPERLTINDEPVEQANVDAIFLPAASFRQAIIYGQTVPLFYDMPVPQRGILLDEVLQLERWLELSALAAKKARALENEEAEADRAIARLEGKLDALEDEAQLQEAFDTWEADHAKVVKNAIAALAASEAKHDEAQKLHKRLHAAYRKTSDVAPIIKTDAIEDRILDARVAVGKAQEAADNAEQLGEFFLHHRNCPTCEQEISTTFADRQRINYDAVRGEARARMVTLNAQITADREKLDEIRVGRAAAEKANTEARIKLASAATAVDHLLSVVEQDEHTANALMKESNPWGTRLDKVQQERRETKEALRKANNAFLRLQSERELMEYWKDGFKRVRLFQIKRTLDFLQLEVANAASALGLLGWTIAFSTEIETKSGSMRPGIHIEIGAPESAAGREWSPGELQRVRLAVSLGLSAMIQRMSGISYAMEVFDEPTNWLASEGIEDLLSCLARRAETTNKSVWLIDHRALQFAGFDQVWTIVKDEDGSHVKGAANGVLGGIARAESRSRVASKRINTDDVLGSRRGVRKREKLS